MKQLTLAIGALLTFASGLAAAPLKLNFEGLEDYSDFSLSGMSEEHTKTVFEKEVLRNRRLAKYVGEERTLEINFSDIDMAGDIQPWRNRYNNDIRYIEGIFPPSFKFTYSLTDNTGAVVAEGEESIRDLSFDFGIIHSIAGSSEFKYEMTLLEDWARKTLPRND